MPGITDPGYELIVAAGRARHSGGADTRAYRRLPRRWRYPGLPTDRFTFIGFLPNKASARRKALKERERRKGTIIALEAPHRLTAALGDILSVLGDRRIAVCRELTKLHEEVSRGVVSEAIKHFTAPRGEFTLVIEGKGSGKKPEMTGDIEKQLHDLYLAAASAKEAMASSGRRNRAKEKRTLPSLA